MTTSPAQTPERVLSTLNADGTRRWLRPRLSPGGYWRSRRVVAYALMVVFFIIPYLRLHGKPLILLDIPRRQFTIIGTTFLPTDTLLFMLLFLSVGIAVFLLTALFGRIWCGWACPQTVYMEFLFRPLERWLERGRSGSLAIDRAGHVAPRRVLTWMVYTLLALFLAHTFLAYFVGIDQLVHWVRSSPHEHPTAFFVMALTTGAVLFDFSYFREQTCLVACPYGRLQAVLLDQQSLIVGYDARRGEPRGKPGKGEAAAGLGDCVDCGACVVTCPTGIDIREGLQMECIHCTQCADACDEIMDRVGKPRGLVRYTSREELEGRPRRFLRPRVVLYPLALLVTIGLLGFFLETKTDTDVTVLRGMGAPYTLSPEGMVLNQVRIRVQNRSGVAREFRIAMTGQGPGQLIVAETPFRLAAGELRTTSVFITLPRGAFEHGERHVAFRLTDASGAMVEVPYNLVGPEEEEHEAAEGREH